MKLERLRALGRRLLRRRWTAARAFDVWSETYDAEENTIVRLSETFLDDQLRSRWQVRSRAVLDVGCGTGRGWPIILRHEPAKLAGADPSQEMLKRLSARYPQSEVYALECTRLGEIGRNRFDVILSTLTLGYLRQLPEAMSAMRAVLEPGGWIGLIDLHPDALRAGIQRAFSLRGRIIEIESRVHTTADVAAAAASAGLRVEQVTARTLESFDLETEWPRNDPLLIAYTLSG
jgi:SAM-dependent methyltransferase